VSKKCAQRVSHLIKGTHVLSEVEAEKRNKKDEQRLRTQSRQSMNTNKTYTNNSPTVR
jgi:hypothetical protein